MQPCASTLTGSVGTFVECFQSLLATSLLVKLWRQHGPKPRGQTPKLSGSQLVQSLVFHVLCGVGTLAAHVQQLTGVKVSDSDLSQRRAAAGVGVFETIVRAALRPLATLQEHPSAFYRGWRLVAIDGSQTSVSNTPQLLRHLSKAASRRFQAAFAKVPLCWLVELGTHAPLAAVVGLAQESEWALAHRLLAQLPAGCLLLADRLYGVGAFVNELLVVGQTVGSQWLGGGEVRRRWVVGVKKKKKEGRGAGCVGGWQCPGGGSRGRPAAPQSQSGLCALARDRGPGAAAGRGLGDGATMDQPAGRVGLSGGGVAGLVCAALGHRSVHQGTKGRPARRHHGIAKPHAGDRRAGDSGIGAGDGDAEPGALGGGNNGCRGATAD